MLILGIETSCDETSAAVVEETGDAAKPWAIRSNVVASQVPIHREWGGVVPELASRQHIRDICGVVERALDEAGDDVARSRRDRGHAGAGPRRIAARRRVVRQGRRRGGRPAARRRPSSGRPHRVARAAERRAAAAGGRARRVGRAHEPVSRRAARLATSCSAARETMRRARRTTRWRSCSASAIPGGPVIDRLARDRQRSRGRAADDAADARRPECAGAEGRSRLQLQRPEDRGAAPRARARRRRCREQEIADICASFQRVVVTALIDRLFDAARRYRGEERRRRRRRVGQQPAARRAGGARRARARCRRSCRAWRCRPTTPR